MSKKDDDIRLADLEQDDRDWLNILTGENVPEANPKTRYEARGLRNAIRSEARLQKITKRLFWHRMVRRVQYQLTRLFSDLKELQWQMAITVIVGMTLGWLLRPYFDSSVAPIIKEASPVTTTTDLPFKLSEYQPQQKANELQQKFSQAGAKVEILSAFQINISIPENPSDKLRDLCDDYDIKLKEDTSFPKKGQIIVLPLEQ